MTDSRNRSVCGLLQPVVVRSESSFPSERTSAISEWFERALRCDKRRPRVRSAFFNSIKQNGLRSSETSPVGPGLTRTNGMLRVNWPTVSTIRSTRSSTDLVFVGESPQDTPISEKCEESTVSQFLMKTAAPIHSRWRPRHMAKQHHTRKPPSAKARDPEHVGE